MAIEHQYILPSILNVVEGMDKKHPNGVAVSEPPLLASRDRVSKIHDEGEMFGGIEMIGTAEAWLAPNVAPHIPPSIPVGKYLEDASGVFRREVYLSPKYGDVQFFSPQVVLWWKKYDSQKPYDFIDIYSLPDQEKRDFFTAISKKSRQAIEFVTRLKGAPTIWGTWGYGTREEREKEGLTRGGPTLKEGHIHFAFLNPDDQQLIFSKLSPKEKLNHYAPWNKIILEKFGNPFRTMIVNILRSQYIDVTLANVRTEDYIKTHKNGAVSIYDGFIIDLGGISFDKVLCALTEIAGRFENLYRKIHELYSHYHGGSNNITKSKIEGEIFDILKKEGFQSDEAHDFTHFILSIQPTYGQLLKWRDALSENPQGGFELSEIEETIRKYERFRKKLENRQRPDNLHIAIVEDQVKEPTDTSITQTWSVCSSFCYIIDDYHLEDDNIVVGSLRLHPEFVTTESGTEKELGVVLKRPFIDSPN